MLAAGLEGKYREWLTHWRKQKRFMWLEPRNHNGHKARITHKVKSQKTFLLRECTAICGPWCDWIAET